MALKPRQITKDVVRATFAEAVRAQAPQSNLEEWYFEASEESGVGRDVIRRLARDPDGPAPDALTIARLTAYFGPEFADQWLGPLTGVRCTTALGAAETAGKFVAGELRGLAEILENPEQCESPAVSDLDDRRRA